MITLTYSSIQVRSQRSNLNGHILSRLNERQRLVGLRDKEHKYKLKISASGEDDDEEETDIKNSSPELSLRESERFVEAELKCNHYTLLQQSLERVFKEEDQSLN